MKRIADGSFLPENVDGTSLRDAGLPVSNAHRLYEEKIDFACLGGRKNKSLNHPYLVTTVTDSNNSGLVMFRYSANSVCEFAAGSSSGRFKLIFAQVSTEPTFLEEANFKIQYLPEDGSRIPGPIANKYFPTVSARTTF